MGLTLDQAKSIGLGHLHPGVARNRSAEQDLVDRFMPPATTAAVRSDGMNKLERRFRDTVLEPAWTRHDIGHYFREPIKLRLAGRTYYSPDFLVTSRPGEHGIPPAITFVECKGFMREDAAVKLKVAASAYPCFGWLLVTRDRWGWHVRRVDGSGIGREEITVSWINGVE
jgi:hypothetical protein